MDFLKCKPGDIAIVICDEPGCEANLGRLVEVRGPLDVDDHGLDTWLIRPLHNAAWSWMSWPHGIPTIRTGPCTHTVEHPDAWLLPLRGFEDDCSSGVKVEPALETVLEKSS